MRRSARRQGPGLVVLGGLFVLVGLVVPLGLGLVGSTGDSRVDPAASRLGVPRSPTASSQSVPVATPSALSDPALSDPALSDPALLDPAPQDPAASDPAAPDAPAGSAGLLLAGLEVKGRAPRTGYDRDLFGQTWADTDRNGCDTRNDILRRDLTGAVLREGSNGCVVLTGTLLDPFSARTIAFQRGEATSSAVQVDHIVPLSDAWQKGAQQWTPQRRVAFANDRLNLLAVDGPLNSQKSDGDAATWLPPSKAFRCAYVARQVAVKAKFAVWVTAAEHDAIAGILRTCPDEPAPTSNAPTESSVGAAEALPTPAPVAGPSAPAGAPACDASYPGVCIPPVSLAGDLDCGSIDLTDVVVLPPDPHGLDRDGDGLGCVS